MRAPLLLIVVCFLVLSASAQRVMHTKLIDLKKQKESLRDILDQADAGIVVFYSPECPLCKNYTRTLNELQVQYPDVPVIAVYCGLDYPDSTLLAFNTKYQVSFNTFRDPKYRLAKRMGATVTPEAFLITAEGQILYSGLIDNWVIDLGGNHRRTITKHHLKEALNAWQKGRQVALTRTEPKGCLLYAK